MSKILVIGAGYVGKAIAIDLAKKYEVTSGDIDAGALQVLSDKYQIKTKILDVKRSESFNEAIKQFDIVISAVPGHLGLRTMNQVIKEGKNLVDISFMPEDAMRLDELAKANDVAVIMDCGVAPGLPNFIIGYYNELMKIDKVEYYVGGLPKVRTGPFEYKATFSPIDVIEEYIRPARFIENGKPFSKPAMSDPELIEFEKAGTLEAFNTDGLRSLLFTMNQIPDMREKTLRYPGHIKLVKAFMDSGFFSSKPVIINDVSVKPLDLTLKLLFDNWKLNEDDEEFTVLRVKISGTENGIGKEIIYDLYDEYDYASKTSSMARTTGYTASAAADMLLNNLFSEKGVFPPEHVGKYGNCFNHVLDYLKERNIILRKTEIIK